MIKSRKLNLRPPDTRNVYRHVRIPPAAVSDPNHHPLQVLSATRLRRALSGDKLDDFLEKMEAISRIFTAISLELGLINGSIDINKVLPELLHMGNVTVAELTAIDDTKVDAAMTEMGGLSGRLKSGDEVKKVEKRLGALENLRKAAVNFGDIENLNGQVEYKAKIATLTGIETDFKESLVDSFCSDVAFVRNNWKKLENYENENFTDDAAKVGFIGLFKPFITMIANEATKLNNSISKLEAVRQHGVSFLQPLLDESVAQKGFDFSTGLTKGSLGKENLDTLLGSSKTFQNAEKSLKTIHNLIHLRENRKLWKFENSAGFPNGVGDLERVRHDASQKWLKERMGNDTARTVESLKNFFDVMDDLKRELKDMNDELTPIKPSVVESVNVVLSAQKDISKLSQRQMDIVDKIIKCDEERPTELPTDAEKTAAIGAILELDSTLNKLTFMKNFDNITSLQDFKAAATFKSDTVSDHPAEIPGMLTTLRGLEEAKTTLSIAKSIEKTADVLKGLATNIKTIVENINTSLTTGIPAYQKALREKKVLEMYNCLKAVGDDAALVGSIMNQMEKIRQLSSSSKLKESVAGVNAVLNSKTHVLKIQGKSGRLRYVKMTEVDAMRKLMPNAKENSKKLGRAVQGLRKIREAELAKSQMSAIFNDLEFIRVAADKSRMRMPMSTYENVVSIANLGATLNSMFDQIAEFQTSLDNLSDSNLADYSDVFKKASQTVKPVTVDAKSLIAAVKRLAELDSTFAIASSSLVSSLETLDNLDLDFASYKMDEADESLKSMDKFLSEFANHLSTAPTLAPNTRPSTARAASGTVGITSEPDNTMAVVGGAAGLLVFIGLVIVAVLIWFCRKKEKKMDEPAEQGPSPSDVIEPIGPPPVELNSRILPGDRPRNQKNKFFEKKKRLVPIEDPTIRIVIREVKELNLDKTQSLGITNEQILACIYTGHQMMLTLFEKENKPFSGYGNKCLGLLTNTVPDGVKVIGPKNEKRDWRGVQTKTLVTVDGFENNFIHANKMTIGDESWIMSQAPLDGTEQILEVKMKSTVEKHWAMICQQNVVVMAQLCNFVEDVAVHNLDQIDVKKDVKTCARYYPEETGKSLTFGKYTVTTKAIIDVSKRFTLHEDYKCFELECLDKSTKKIHRVVLLRFFGWLQSSAPQNPENGGEIVEFLQSYKGVKLVHSHTGAGRAETVVAIRKGIEMSLRGHGDIAYHYAEPVLMCRNPPIEWADQMTYITMATGLALMKILKMEEVEEYDRLLVMWFMIVSGEGNFDWKCEDGDEQRKREIIDDMSLVRNQWEEKLAPVEKKWAEKKKKREEAAAEVLRQADEERKRKEEGKDKLPSKEDNVKKSEDGKKEKTVEEKKKKVASKKDRKEETEETDQQTEDTKENSKEPSKKKKTAKEKKAETTTEDGYEKEKERKKKKKADAKKKGKKSEKKKRQKEKTEESSGMEKKKKKTGKKLEKSRDETE